MQRTKNTRKKDKRSRAGKQLISRPVRPPKSTWGNRSGPPEIDVQLMYTSVVTAGAGASSAYKRFNPNSYIPEFSGTQASAEFVHYAAMYDFYRVIRFKVEFDIVNQDTTTSIIVFLCHNEDFNSEPLGNLSGNAYAVTKTLGSVNGASSRARYTRTFNMPYMVGSEAPNSADSYRALINSNPADVVWAGFGLFGTGTMTNGVAGTARITQYIRFYNQDLASQTTAPSLSSKQELDAIQARRDAKKLIRQNSQLLSGCVNKQ